MRIQKYLSQNKICSRREAEDLIRRGLIKVNGQTATIGMSVESGKDRIEIIGKPEQKITIAFYKPRGVVSEQQKVNGQLLNTVGRLDKESEGLILLSNDGTVTAAVTSEKHIIEKEYEATVQEQLSPSKIKKLATGVVLDDGPTLPTTTKLLGSHRFLIILKEGRNHQIRRMAATLNLTVTKIKRIRIGNIKIGNLKIGTYCVLSQDEIVGLKN